MLDQTPLGNETGCPHDMSAFSGGDKFFEIARSRDFSSG
jgi:hypothetical protein